MELNVIFEETNAEFKASLEQEHVFKSLSIEKVEQTAESSVSEGVNELTITLSDGTESKFNVRNGAKGDKGDKGDPGYVNINDAHINTSETWSSKNTVDKLCPSFTESGAVVACEPVEGYPLEVVSKIEPTQEGSGDPSFENIRPIVGHTVVNLSRCGKNLLNEDWKRFKNYTYNQNLVLNLPKGQYVISAEKTDNAYLYLQKSTDGGATLETYYRLHTNNSPTVNSKTFEVTGTEGEMWMLYTNGQNSLNNLVWMQIECGEMATSYEPYCGESFTVELGQTVYGGSYNWNTGLLTIDRVKYTLPSGHFGADGNQFYNALPEPSLASDTSYNCICSHYPSRTRNQVYSNANTEGYLGCSVSNGYVRVVDNARFNGDTSAFNAWLAENNVEVVYQLANPKTIQLTPQEVLALSGVNTLYGDTGNITVSGKADPTVVIQKLTNAIIALGGNV